MASLEQIISFVKGDKTSISHPLKVLLFEMINVTVGLCVYIHRLYRYVIVIHTRLKTGASLSENTMHTSITKTQVWTVMNYE